MMYLSLFDSVAKAIKKKEELSMVTCVYAHRREISQNPVCGFTLAFEAGAKRYADASETVGRKEITEVKLCLLAPSGAGGKRLAECAEWISQAIRESECDDECSEIVISSPSYNETASVLYTDITVSFLKEYLSEPETVVLINDENVERLVSFSAERKVRSQQGEGELLNGQSFVDVFYYSVNLSAEIPLKNLTGEFTLRLKTSEAEEEYRRCRIDSYSCKYLSGNKMIFSYSITSSEKGE